MLQWAAKGVGDVNKQTKMVELTGLKVTFISGES